MILQTIFAFTVLFAYMFANVAQLVRVTDCKNKKNQSELAYLTDFLLFWGGRWDSPLSNKPILNKPDTSFSSYSFFWYLYR